MTPSDPEAGIPASPLQPILERPSDVDLTSAFLVRHLQHERGSSVPWEVLYEHYADWWADGPGDTKPLSAGEFGIAMARVCKAVPIKVVRKRGKPHCLHVRLVDPVKMLPAPDMGTP